MKRLILLVSLGLATATALPLSAKNFNVPAPAKEDTVLVKLANGAKLNLIVDNTAQLKSFQNYSLDSLMLMLNKYIAEAEKMEKKDVNSKDYTVSFRPAEETTSSKAPEKINITFKGTDIAGGKSERKEVTIKVDYDDADPKKEITISTDSKNDTSEVKKVKNRRTVTELGIGLGFNTLLNTGDNALGINDLKPWGSRFVSLAYTYKIRVGGTKSPFYLKTGIEAAFNNYMFDKNIQLTNDDSYTIFTKASRDLDKSKLATSTLNLPLVALLDFKNKKGNTNFRIGAGGFIGYRLGAHTKIKYNLDGDSKKDKDHENFNLQDLQYGAKFLIGYRGLDLFANYNLNELFKENKGPKANTLSFGFGFDI